MKKIYIHLILYLSLIFTTGQYCAFAEVANKVVAVVNDEVITQEDVNHMLGLLYAQYVHAYKGDELLEKMEELKKTILLQMIDDRLILSCAKGLEVKVSEEEIEEKMDMTKTSFPSEKEFYTTLEAQGITAADLKNRYKDQIMMKKILDYKVKSKVEVLPQDIAGYYEEYKSDFKIGPVYRVRLIFIKARNKIDFELSRIEAARVYSRLKKGEDFSELAKRYSQGPHKNEGGDIGYIELGTMLKPIDDALLKLRPGEYSEPIKTDKGYHIVKLEDFKEVEYLALEEVKDDINKELFKQKYKERLEKWVGELRDKAYISIKK